MAGKLFLTGDTHGPAEIGRLSFKNHPELRELDRDDLVVILGDFGMPWTGSNDERHWLKWLEERPWTTCFVDGNHEGFPALAELPTERRLGADVGVVSPHVLHLRRGRIYDLAGHRAWCMGGAESIDRAYRTPGFDWFCEEMPSASEMERAEANLEAINYDVDLVLTHDAPTEVGKRALMMLNPYCPFEPNFRVSALNHFLDHVDYELEAHGVDCSWYFGHYHGDIQVTGRHRLLWHDIIEI